MWKLPAEVRAGTVVLKDEDGNPFEFKNKYGKGTVAYFTSSVTLAYLRRGNPVVHQWILEPALKQVGEMPIQLKKGSDHLLFRGLVGASGTAAILTNWGETQNSDRALQWWAQGDGSSHRQGSAGNDEGRQDAGDAAGGCGN